MPEWMPIFGAVAACAAILMALRLIFREKRLDAAKNAIERAAELEKIAAAAELRGASNTELANEMTALRLALTNVTSEISGLKMLATEVLKVGIELAHVKAAVDLMRDEMKLLAEAERVHETLDSMDRRMRDVEQHLAKWSGKFTVTGVGTPPSGGDKR